MYAALRSPIFVAKTICDKAVFFLSDGKIDKNRVAAFYRKSAIGYVAGNSQQAKSILS